MIFIASEQLTERWESKYTLYTCGAVSELSDGNHLLPDIPQHISISFCNMLSLPKELLKEVLSFLNKSDLIATRNACNLLRNIADEIFFSITYRVSGKVDANQIIPLGSFSHVRNIDLRSTSVEDEDLKLIRESELTSLDLSWCKMISDDSMKILPRTLKVLRLTSCNIGDNGLAFLPSSLTELDLFCCSRYAETSRNVIYIRRVSDEGIAGIQHIPLAKLVLHGRSKLTQNCFRFLPLTLKVRTMENFLTSGFGASAMERNIT